MGISRLANAKSRSRRTLGLVALGLVAALLVAGWFSPPGQRLRGDAVAGVAYAARVSCSCRYVAGRSLEDCGKDKLAGMELLSLAADDEAKSVTASMPLVASDTARFRAGYGCVLDSWRARAG